MSNYNPIDWFYQNKFGDDEYMCTPTDNANHRKQRGRTAPNRALRLRKKKQKTMLEYFKETYHGWAIFKDGLPLRCPYAYGCCKDNKCYGKSCKECWNRPMDDINHFPDVTKKVGE